MSNISVYSPTDLVGTHVMLILFLRAPVMSLGGRPRDCIKALWLYQEKQTSVWFDQFARSCLLVLCVQIRSQPNHFVLTWHCSLCLQRRDLVMAKSDARKEQKKNGETKDIFPKISAFHVQPSCCPFRVNFLSLLK